MTDDEAVDNANTAPPAPPDDGVTYELRSKIRYVCLKQAKNGEWYFRAEGGNREPLYTSETFSRKSDAKEAAIREHVDQFEYVLEYDSEDGVQVRETL